MTCGNEVSQGEVAKAKGRFLCSHLREERFGGQAGERKPELERVYVMRVTVGIRFAKVEEIDERHWIPAVAGMTPGA